MKKFKGTIMVALLCFMLTGCNNAYAKNEYDAAEKIAKNDRYAKQMSVLNPIEGGYSLEVTSFDGRETICTKSFDEEQDIDVEVKLTLSEGTAKLVHVDEDGTVTTICESTSENAMDEYEMKTVRVRQGKNRFKIVGYDCKDLDLKLTSPAF